MCIIVAKPEGVKMPSYETLETCFNNNPDGAGFMYADGKTVRIRKGFMDFNDFVDAINLEFGNEDATDFPIVMHFRIQTSGTVMPECTHPFPITSDEKKMCALRTESRWGIAHNGIIHGRNTHKGWSDTMDFVAGIVAPLSKINANFMRNDDCIELLKSACGSKLCILENSGEIKTIGDFQTVDGVLYSNSTYAAKKTNWSSYASAWDGYDDYYGRYWGNTGTSYSRTLLDATDAAREITTDDLAKYADELPFYACDICVNRMDCTVNGEECRDESEAIESCAFYGDMTYDEVAELLFDDLNESQQEELLLDIGEIEEVMA